MEIWLWFGVLLVAVASTHWGSERLARPLEKLRRQWGITAAAGGAVVALATASPELGMNVTSAARGVSDIGLGQSLGSNVIAIPLTVTVAYLATRRRELGRGGAEGDETKSVAAHGRHLEQRFLRVQREAVAVLTLPYLGLLALIALLTLPARWRGLQPVDGFILLLAFVAYLTQALYRGRKQGRAEAWTRREIWLAVAGVYLAYLGVTLFGILNVFLR